MAQQAAVASLTPAKKSGRDIGFALGIIAILCIFFLPIPAFMIDLGLAFSIALSVLILMVALWIEKPLEFSAFPTILLVSTMLRLALNIATTRLILTHGAQGVTAAGYIIGGFARLVMGGDFVIGLVVFIILITVNFLVITKGATRIAEVGARFTLDAIPGKQMAIDADLSAGLINDKEAQQRRRELEEESSFFGSMDGASKFVRGDAIAGILILFINVIGGFTIGVLQHDLSASQAADTYILLAVGDALVAQIPGLLISVAAAMVVSRVGKDRDIGGQIVTQMFGSAKILGITGAILGFLGIIPGMPHVVFLVMGSVLGYAAWVLATRPPPAVEAPPVKPKGDGDATWDDLQPVDLLGLELGYRLITLVDKNRQGDLLNRIKGVRRKFAQEVGFLPPAVHVRDNLELKPSAYRITLRGVIVGEGEAFPNMFLAINPGGITTPLIDTATTDPAFGLPAHWIDNPQKEAAQMAGFTVVDSETVMATHLSHLMQVQASKLLSRTETQQLVEHVAKLAPKLIEEVVPKMVSIAVFQKTLQLLLDESVHIRDIRTIIESIAEHAPSTTDPVELAKRVRVALSPAIVQQIYGSTRELNVIAIDPSLERLLVQALGNTAGPALDPGVADMLSKNAAETAMRQEEIGVPACLLVPDQIRGAVARLVRRMAPRLQVLAHSEIPETHTIRIGPILRGAT